MTAVELNADDYVAAVKFALKMWFSGKSTTEWRGSVRRGFGEYLEDFVPGKLAEVAFCRFLVEAFGLRAQPNFEVYPGIRQIDQGDVGFVLSGREIKYLSIDVKATKPTARWACLDEKEFRNRPYKAYVWALLELPVGHLAGLVYEAVRNGNLEELGEDIRRLGESLRSIKAELAGFALREDLERDGVVFPKGSYLYDPATRRRLVQCRADNRCLLLDCGGAEPCLRKNWRELAEWIRSQLGAA
jgi:hypothetical protein